MVQSHVKPNKGTGFYPITDLQFDVISIIYDKCKMLQKYDKYITDGLANSELMRIFEEIAQDDRRHVESLKRYLGTV